MKLTINEGLKRFFVEINAYNFVALEMLMKFVPM